MELTRYVGRECIIQFKNYAWFACHGQGGLNLLTMKTSEGDVPARMPFLHGDLAFDQGCYFVKLKDERSKKIIEVGIDPTEVFSVTVLGEESRVKIIQ